MSSPVTDPLDVVSASDVDETFGEHDELVDAELVELLRQLEPGPTAMMVLASLDVDALDGSALVDMASLWERQSAWVAAQGQRALAALAQAKPDDEPLVTAGLVDVDEWRSDLVAASLRWSPCTAAHRLDVAATLVAGLAPTFQLLEAGEISARHALVLAEAVGELTSEERAFVQTRVLEKAPAQTVVQFTRSVQRAVLAAAPELAAARRAQAIAHERGVRVSARPDGMAALVATMSAVEAFTVFEALDAAARKAQADVAATTRQAADTSAASCADTAPAAPAGERAGGKWRDPAAVREVVRLAGLRADALLAWANDALADPALPRRQGRRVELQVVVDLPSLLGLADNPAELVGYGPIPAEAARELAGDATWRRLVIDPVDGHLLDYGAVIYRPPQRLLDFIIARDRRCRFPGCGRRADACDVDHVCPHGDQGGKTAACNCCCLCRKHHRAKTHGGWHLELRADGSAIWIAPNGRLFHVDPVNQLE